MTGVENLFIYWPGRHNLDQGGNFSKFIGRGSHRGESHRVTWAGCVIEQKEALLNKRSFKMFARSNITDYMQYLYVYMKLYVYFYCHYTYLNHITGHQLEAIHLSFCSINIIMDLFSFICKKKRK